MKSFFVFIFCVPLLLFAGEYAVKIREAAYLFEMKGDVNRAVEILNMVSEKGSKEDCAEADFLLGKIRELTEKKESAIFHYKQTLLESEKPAQVYWTAARLAVLTEKPEQLIEKPLVLQQPIRQIFYGDSVRFLLQNNSIYTPYTKRISEIPQEIPAGAQILKFSDSGIWWEDGIELHFTPLRAVFPEVRQKIKKRISDFQELSPYLISYIDGEEFVLLAGNTERVRTTGRYKDCDILDSRSSYSPVFLNCPDNALHLLSKDDGKELDVISMLDPISKIYFDESGILLFSGDALWFYRQGRISKPLWRKKSVAVEDIISFGNYFAVLEASGSVSLFHKQTGEIRTREKTSASSLFALNTGLLGLLSGDGALIAADTLLRPLWIYHFGKFPIFKPWTQNGKFYFPATSDSVKILNVLHYGKSPTLSILLADEASKNAYNGDWETAMQLADSALALEPGNAEAKFLKALYLDEIKADTSEREKAWSETIRISTHFSEPKTKILNHYARIVGAKYVKKLELSPHTLYPHFFTYKNNLLTLDPASRQLLCFNAETGEKRWSTTSGKMESSPVTAFEKNTLALASGFSLSLFNLEKQKKAKTLEMPGKVFHIAFGNDALYVTTWNGFLIKILLADKRQAWSRKVGFNPFFVVPHFNGEIVLAFLNGVIQHADVLSGQIRNTQTNLQAEITQIIPGDSAIAFLTADKRLLLYTSPDKAILTLSFEDSPLYALFIRQHNKNFILISFSNQEIKLFELPTGNVVWNYKGTRSVFGKMVLSPIKRTDGTSSIWIDQGDDLIELSIATGKILKQFPTPGGSGTPFISGRTLFSATPQQLLYAFPLE